MSRRWILVGWICFFVLSAWPDIALAQTADNDRRLAFALIGSGIALMLIIVTVWFWKYLFQNAAVGSVTVGLWFMIMISGSMGIVFALGLFGWAIYLRREVFLRWYYLLTPHPAAKLVDRVLQNGEALDADAFAEAIRASGENPTQRAVQAEQVAVVTKRWREHERAIRADEASVIDAERREAASENALLQAQADAIEAAIAHELAAARLEELQRSQR